MANNETTLKPRNLLPALVATSVLASAQADVIFEETFDSDDNRAGLAQWKGTENKVDESRGAWLEIREDADNAFSNGKPNRVLVMHDQSDIEQCHIRTSIRGAGDVVTASVDFVEPPGAEIDVATRREVRRCFEAAGAGGDYILSPSDHYFDAEPGLVRAFAEEARLCTYQSTPGQS